MKVVCTINYYNHIIVGKTYDVVKNHNIYGGPLEDGNLYCISDDDNFHRWVPKGCFNLLEDIREEKLKELGIY